MFYISIVSGSEPQGQISLGKYAIIKKKPGNAHRAPHTRHLPAACLTYAYNEPNKPYLTKIQPTVILRNFRTLIPNKGTLFMPQFAQ